MLKDKKLFLFDIDGTLALGNDLFDGTAELLSYIGEIGGMSFFITNNSTMSSDDYVKKFARCFGLKTSADFFITSGYMTIAYMKEHFMGKNLFVVGTGSYMAELEKNGLTVTDEPLGAECVLVCFDNSLTYKKLENACLLLSDPKIPFYATNSDLCCPASFGFIPDCGSICQMLTSCTGRTPVYLGKPSRAFVDVCIQKSHFTPKETIVIGDRLYTDIACGINAGVDTCVVYTGEATPKEAARSEYLPTYAFENIRAFYEALKNASSQS